MIALLKSILFWAVMGPVLALLKMIKPLVFIRVQTMLTYRIGHYSMNNEMYLCEKDAGLLPKRSFDIFFHTPLVCNAALKQIMDRGPQRIWQWSVNIMKAIERSGWCKDHVIETSSRDRYGIYEFSKQHFFLNQEEQATGQAFLGEHGINPEKFVCLLCRDSAYMNQHQPDEDWSYHDYRDVDIATYLPALEALTDQGYHVLRMGAAVHQSLTSENPRILDYANNGMRTELLDIFLSATCTFFISNGSGLDGIAKMFRRPIVYVNLAPLAYIRSENSYDMILPKLLKNTADTRLLTIGELMAGPGAWHETRQYKKAGLVYVDNTLSEIRDALLEMEERVRGTWRESEEDAQAIKRFWSHFKPDESNGIFRARIASSFLHRYPQLLSGPSGGHA